jgi:hypothetical protein
MNKGTTSSPSTHLRLGILHYRLAHWYFLASQSPLLDWHIPHGIISPQLDQSASFVHVFNVSIAPVWHCHTGAMDKMRKVDKIWVKGWIVIIINYYRYWEDRKGRVFVIMMVVICLVTSVLFIQCIRQLSIYIGRVLRQYCLGTLHTALLHSMVMSIPMCS